MNSLADVQQAVIAAWPEAAGASLHYDKAPKGTPYPHTVFLVSSDADHTFGGHAEQVRLQFNSFSKETSQAQINAINEAIKIAYGRTALNLNSHRLAKRPRQETEAIFTNDSGNQQGTLIFNLRIQ